MIEAWSRRALAIAWVCALGFGCATGGGISDFPTPQPGRPTSVVLISIPGLTAARLRPDAVGDVAMPNVAALAKAGVLATGVESVVPAALYPSHATLLTGRIPALHGVTSDHPLGEKGVRATTFAHASALLVPTLWQRVNEAGRTVGSLDWPTTQGAEITWLVPDVPPLRRGQTWLEAIAESATPPLGLRLAAHGAEDPAASKRGPERDVALVEVACELLSGDPPPQLVLLRLGQTEPAWSEGPDSAAAKQGFEGADAEVGELLGCLSESGVLDDVALSLVGGHVAAAVHTAVAPNVVLAERGLRREAESWRALARSNGGTAFVYARDERAAVAARLALAAAASESGAFRVIPASEMIALQADPEAWFGLEAFPGFAFVNEGEGALLRAAPARGASGSLPSRAELSAAFVAWGRGVRRGLTIPQMRETDVAPTLASLLDVDLGETDGRSMVGLLALSPARDSGAEAEPRDGR